MATVKKKNIDKVIKLCCIFLLFIFFNIATASDEIELDIKINRADGPLVLNADEPVSLTVSSQCLEPASEAVDWWLYADTDYGFFSYLPDSGWISGLELSMQWQPLIFFSYEIFNGVLPEGEYSFMFAMDRNADGLLDGNFQDKAELTICPVSKNTSNFVSGNIGTKRWQDHHSVTFEMRDDNDDCTLPLYWRTWWYLKLDDIPLDTPVNMLLKGRGWPYYYTPVYSCDRKTWHRFSENEVIQPSEYELEITKTFSCPTVWLSRFYPYTEYDLAAYLGPMAADPMLKSEEIGLTSQGRSLVMLSITDPDVPGDMKNRVFIHARTHPAEIGGSLLIEGLLDFFLKEDQGREALANLILNIVPLHNLDGIAIGNYRTNPDSRNLEVEWFRDPEDPKQLLEKAAGEVKTLHKTILRLNEEGPRVSMALNLHSSNSEPDIKPFFYPHFGPISLGYSEEEANLWEKQILFINEVARYYDSDLLEPLPEEGGSSFVEKSYPESWWWANFKDDVMAITIETTYGRAGYTPDWITPDNLRDMGKSIGRAIVSYYTWSEFERKKGYVIPFKTLDKTRIKALKYPENYPPLDSNEMKE